MNLLIRFGTCLFFICWFGATALRAQPGIPERINHDNTRGRSLEQLEEQARAAFSDKEYYKAIKLYQLVVKDDSLRRTAWYGLAQAAVAHGAYLHADSAYSMLLRHHMIELEPQELLLVADIKYRLARYAGARPLYDTLTRHPEAGADVRLAAVRGQRLVRWAQDTVQSRTDTAFLSLDTATINTQRYSEFAPFPLRDTLYYSAYRLVQEAGVLRAERERMQAWYAPGAETGALLPATTHFNETERHTAHTAFDPAGRVMYYSVCRGEQGSADLRCTLYRRERQPDGSWGAAQKLPAPVNLDGSTSAEPTVGHLPGDTSAVALFFVSDRAGSRQRDIWYSRIFRDSFGTPLPLAAVNTAGNDVTPYFHHESRTLYFSTDGRNSLGGLDVYAAAQTGNTWAPARHLDRPVNSGANDAFYTRSVGGKYEFWSSNRRGLANTSEDDCCYDLFAMGGPVLKAVAFNERTGDSLAGTHMQLFDITGGTRVLVAEADVAGFFHTFPISSGRQYEILVTKNRFRSDRETITTGRLAEDMVVNLYLFQGRIKLIVAVANCAEAKKTPVDDAQVQVLHITPALALAADSVKAGGLYYYTLDFDQSYTPSAKKDCYFGAAASVVTNNFDYTRDTTINRELCLAPGVLLTVRVREKFTKEPINGAQFWAYETRTPQNVRQFTDPNSNVYHDTIRFRSNYYIAATKDNYSSDSVFIRTGNPPALVSSGQECPHIDTVIELIRLLPIRLFFDNARPNIPFMANPDGKNRQYYRTYFDYQPKKEEFIANYTRGLSGAEAQRARDSVDAFFEKEVRRGWEALKAFSETLYPKLQRGDTITLVLRGYASPLGNAVYNQLLTRRRVQSVHDHFRFFDEFVQNNTYGLFYGRTLFIKEEPMGEVPDRIDDTPNRRESVYSVSASRARRLELLGVIVSAKKPTSAKDLSTNKNPTP